MRNINNEIEKAITFLRFNRHIDAITTINKEINENFITRNNEMSEESKKSKAIRKAAYYDLKIFIDLINLFVKKNTGTKDDTIYLQYSREIKNLLRHYHTILKSRITKSKNKREVATAVKELISKQQDPQQSLPKGNEDLKTENIDLKNSQSATNNMKYNSNESSKSNKIEWKKQKGIDGEVPPISKN